MVLMDKTDKVTVTDKLPMIWGRGGGGFSFRWQPQRPHLQSSTTWVCIIAIAYKVICFQNKPDSRASCSSPCGYCIHSSVAQQ